MPTISDLLFIFSQNFLYTFNNIKENTYLCKSACYVNNCATYYICKPRNAQWLINRMKKKIFNKKLY